MAFRELEIKFENEDFNLIGIDEVGRGPIAGPVVACGVSFCGDKAQLRTQLENLAILKVTDSKKLNHLKRKKILNTILPKEIFSYKEISYKQKYTLKGDFSSLSFCLSAKEPSEIERLNILWASMEAMGDCAKSLSLPGYDIVWVDGNRAPKNLPLNSKVETIVKGDEHSLIIGLASILAKEFRDQLMGDYHEQYPEFGFLKNSGYPTPAHKEALFRFGKTPIHRQSFKSVKEVSKIYESSP